MLKYDTQALVKEGQSYYSLVIAVAKRARDIVEKAEEEKQIIAEKPVRLAIDELQSGKSKIIRTEVPAEQSTPAPYIPVANINTIGLALALEDEEVEHDDADSDEMDDEMDDSYEAERDDGVYMDDVLFGDVEG